MVDVKIIDEQHSQLADIINSFIDSSYNHTKLHEDLLKLLELVEIHFITEEDLMKENKFDGYFSHKLEHDRFYKQLLQISDEKIKNNSVLTEETLQSLKRWFINHIELKDKKLGEFLNSIGLN